MIAGGVAGLRRVALIANDAEVELESLGVGWFAR